MSPFNIITARARDMDMRCVWLIALVASALSACGGSGGVTGGDIREDDDDPPPVNAAPSVTLTSPDAGDEVTTPGNLTISANAADSDGEVVSVEFFLNGVSVGVSTMAPFSVTLVDPAAGASVVSATARDDDGATGTSADLAFDIVQGVPAVVALKTPEADQLYATPGVIPLSAELADPQTDVVRVDYFADGTLIASSDEGPDFEANWVDAPSGDSDVTAVAVTDQGITSESAVSDVPIFSQGTFAVDEVQMGDPDTCYGNPEFSDDGRFMTWFEALEGQRNEDLFEIAQMWHCEVDPDTGDFIPPDCRGYPGFRTTLAGRAYMGRDAQGVIYVGADEDYNLTLVRATGATTGETITYASIQDPQRRGIYPSVLPDSDKVYVYWLRSIGDLAPANATTVELRYVDLDDPANEIIIDTQDVPQAGGGERVLLAPMDVTFPRWSWRQPLITYGANDDDSNIQVFTFDVTNPSAAPVQITDDTLLKVGQFPVVYNGERYLAAGLFPNTRNVLYREPQSGTIWEQVEFYQPPADQTFGDACQAASNEPFVFGGRLYTTYQVASCFDTTNVFFSNTSEIWFTELLDGADVEFKLSQGGSDIKNEPEPLVGTSDAWVYYTRYPLGQDQNTACFSVFRAETPLN
ncbi:MAG: Ig-like domain-containing protein [Pseudomonadota bacterium]